MEFRLYHEAFPNEAAMGRAFFKNGLLTIAYRFDLDNNLLSIETRFTVSPFQYWLSAFSPPK